MFIYYSNRLLKLHLFEFCHLSQLININNAFKNVWYFFSVCPLCSLAHKKCMHCFSFHLWLVIFAQKKSSWKKGISEKVKTPGIRPSCCRGSMPAVSNLSTINPNYVHFVWLGNIHPGPCLRLELLHGGTPF